MLATDLGDISEKIISTPVHSIIFTEVLTVVEKMSTLRTLYFGTTFYTEKKICTYTFVYLKRWECIRGQIMQKTEKQAFNECRHLHVCDL